MDKVFSIMLEIAIYSSVIVLIVLILRLVFNKASKAVICALWLLVGLRLLLFVPIESSFAILPELSIKDMVREYSESMEKQPIQETISEADNNIGLSPENDLTQAGNDISAEKPGNVEIIPVQKDGTPYNYENPEGSNIFIDEKANTATEKKTDVLSLLGFIWLGGTVIMYLYGIIKAIKVKRQLSDAVRLEGYEDVYLTAYARNAFVFGLVKPRIYLNYSISQEQRKYVLAHEREHIARKDYIFKVVAFGLLSLYWFVPWVWVAFILYSRDMELACDEGVISSMDPESRARYAETLFGCSITGFEREYNAVSFGELGVNERVKNIMKYKKKTVWISAAAVLTAVLCLVFFLTPKAANADNKQDTDSESGSKNAYSFEQYKEYFDESTGKLSLPEGIESIEDNAFVGCTQIKIVELPSSVKVIGKDAFLMCTNLQQINMPEGLVEIGNYAFKDCNLLTYVQCPSTLEKIGLRAFMNCKSLLKVSLSEKIIDSGTGIEDNAFSGCYSLLDEYKEQILSINPKAYQVDVFDATSDLTNVDYSSKEKAPDKFQMKLDDFYYSFYVVIYAMEDGNIICEDYFQFPYKEKTDCLGEKKRYKLSDDCKIIVQAKDEINKGKVCYIDKTDLEYIARVYGMVKPDGSHESYIKSEYVYPFLCVMDQKGKVRCLRECYDIYEVSQNLYDKVKNVNFTQEQIEDLDKRLKQEGITEYDICNTQELNINVAGQTYGSHLLHADLIPAKGINGNLGYISVEEESSPTANTIEEALEQNNFKGKVIPLYNCDGEIIDWVVVGWIKDEELNLYKLDEGQEDIYILPDGGIGYMENGEIIPYESQTK